MASNTTNNELRGSQQRLQTLLHHLQIQSSSNSNSNFVSNNSPSSNPSINTLSLTSGQNCGRKFCGGIGINGTKGKSRFPVVNVVTEVNSVEQGLYTIAKESQRPMYPFAAIVGQDEMKLCLLLNVIDPKIGGVMIMGDRGTGKSKIKVFFGDPYNSDPKDPEVMGIEVRDRVTKGDGLRGDIVPNRAAKALAALKGRDKVSVEDIAAVIPN